MLIGNKYKVESDGLNIALLELKEVRSGKNKGTKYWSVDGYFGTLAYALKALVDIGVKETYLTDFKTIVKKQEELYKLIEGLKMEVSNEGKSPH